jgi:F-type H+-transporting ATPase subunit epsilon
VGSGELLKVRILNPKHVLFDGEAKSIFLPGDMAEFEILDFHAPIVSLLKPGNVLIDWTKSIPIKRGMVKFDRNECMILVEE